MLNDVSRWARGNGLEIVLLAVGAVLLARVVRWIGNNVTVRLDAKAERQREAGQVPDEQTKHLHSVTQVLSWAVVALIYFVAALLILDKFGLPLGSLVAPAAVVGAALGFGAQRVVQDLLSGFFILIEHQYGFGDVIHVAPSVANPVTGTVEEVTLRATKLRTFEGELVIIANGEIRQVTNLSRDWARAVIDVPVPAGADVANVSDLLRQVCEEAFADEGLQPLLLDAPSVMGVEHLDVESLVVRIVARTQPGTQDQVGRALRARVAAAMRAEGLVVMAPHLATDRLEDRP